MAGQAQSRVLCVWRYEQARAQRMMHSDSAPGPRGIVSHDSDSKHKIALGSLGSRLASRSFAGSDRGEGRRLGPRRLPVRLSCVESAFFWRTETETARRPSLDAAPPVVAAVAAAPRFTIRVQTTAESKSQVSCGPENTPSLNYDDAGVAPKSATAASRFSGHHRGICQTGGDGEGGGRDGAERHR